MGKPTSLLSGKAYLSPQREIYLSSMGKSTSPQWESLPLLNGKAYLLLSGKAYPSSVGKPTFLSWESLPLLHGKVYLSSMKAGQKPHKSGKMDT